MKYTKANPPLVCMQTQSTCYKGTGTMTVKGVLWHSTGANNPNLKRYVQPSDNDPNYAALIKLLGKNTNGNDWNHITRQAGLNCWVGKLADGSVSTVQTMPWNYRPWGCGGGSKGSCNYGWIQFEICEDGLADAAYFNQAYQEACEITAYLCKLYNIDPHGSAKLNGVTVPTILCHWDSYKLGLGSGHGDIYHWFPQYGKDMSTVRDDVAALMSGSSPSATTIGGPATYETDFRTRVVVDDDVLNCRSGAGTSYGVVTSYPNGTILHITKVTDGWGYTGEGWVSLLYTIAIDDNGEKTEPTIETEDDYMTKTQILNEIGDQYITTYDELPEWAKSDMRELLDNGTINGGTDYAANPDDINMYLSDIKTIIVSKRMIEAAKG